MNSKQPKWHLKENNVAAAKTTLTLIKAVLVMAGDLVTGLYESFYPHPYYHTFCEHRKASFVSTLSKLKKDGYLKITTHNNEKIFVLTEKGRKKREKAISEVKRVCIRKESWDGKWRLIIFDIPEKMKKYRDFLRGELHQYGFVQLQKSVWVTPYRIDEDIRILISEHGLARFVKCAVIEKWDDENKLKELFRLA